MRQKNSSFLRNRVSYILLALLLCLVGLSACGKKGAKENETVTPTADGAPTAVPTATPSPTPTVAFYKTAYETAGRSDVYRLPIITPDPDTSAFCIQTSGEYALFSVTQLLEPNEEGDKPSRIMFALCRPLESMQIKYLDPGYSAGVTTLFADGSFLAEDWENRKIRLYDNKMDEVRAYDYDGSWFLGQFLGEADGNWYFFAMNDSRVPGYLAVPKGGGETKITEEEPEKLDTSAAHVQYPYGWEDMSNDSLSATWYFHESGNEKNGIAFTKSRQKEILDCIDGMTMCGHGEIELEDGTETRDFRMYDLSNGTVSRTLSEREIDVPCSLRADGILENKAVVLYARRPDDSCEVLLWVPEDEPAPIAGFCDFTKDEPLKCLAKMVEDLQTNANILITPDILESEEEVAFSEILYEINFANQFALARATKPELFAEGTTVHPENMRNNGTGHYEFNPHVFSKFYELEHGEARKQALFNFVDALRAGEEWFECPDEQTMWWCHGRLGHYFYPVEEPYTFVGLYKDGKGQIVCYDGTTKEEFEEKRDEFERMITDIVNDAVGDDYTDLEKTLALYEFLTEYCTYDYEMLEHSVEWMDRQGGYRALIEKKGICNEFACLYQYLLLQVGVDAEESGGPSVIYGQDSHAWVYVTLDGKGYLVDPTWGETADRAPILQYFLFTDELRESRDLFDASKFSVGGCWEDCRKKYSFEATDTRYEGLWDGTYVAMDRSAQTIFFLDRDGNMCAFYYGE